MKTLLVMGTRPEIIKLYPVYKELKRRDCGVRVYFTNQNFETSLSSLIFKDFPYEKADLIFHTQSPNTVIKEIGGVINSFQPDFVLVLGDTWSTLYGTLAAQHTGCRLGHIEAGLRSYDERMIEEKVRVMVDSVADLLFVPTQLAKQNLQEELGRESYLVGNTIYDLLVGQEKKKPKGYILLTLHRPETVDDPQAFKGALEGVTMVSRHFNLEIKFLVHPRTQDRMQKLFGLKTRFETPIGYLEFIEMLKEASLVMTDSGGIQEEAAILKIPCVTLRRSTERVETVLAGLNIVAGYKPKSIFELTQAILQGFATGAYDPSPLYGDSKAGEKIVTHLLEAL